MMEGQLDEKGSNNIIGESGSLPNGVVEKKGVKLSDEDVPDKNGNNEGTESSTPQEEAVPDNNDNGKGHGGGVEEGNTSKNSVANGMSSESDSCQVEHVPDSNGNGTDSGGPSKDEDVPDTNGNSAVVGAESNSSSNSTNTTPKGSVKSGVPNGVTPTGSGSCQALLLSEDFNRDQMSAAKRFLKMVREGAEDNLARTTAAGSSQLKGGDSSADEDGNPISTNTPSSSNKSTILNGSSGNTINNFNVAVGGVTPKEKPVGRSALLKGANSAAAHLPILEKGPPPSCVQEVWAHNLLEEFAKIRKIVKQYTYIAMDTEFPGIVVRPQCAVRGAGVFPYELLKVNVDRLKIIQLGVTFMDKNGKTPPGVCTWQFNFRFSLNKDLYASDSISLLTRCGIQFERHAEQGIDPEMFGEYFMSSGMVTSDQVTYLTFHSGFDFGYLIKLLSNLPLPDNEEKFFEIMKIYFPNVYDLKFLMKSVDLHGGLQDIANQMGQERVGTQHQAGSDSLLTGMTFFKLQTDVFNNEIDETKYCGKLYGFHMTEDGKDEGWSEITGEGMLDATSPKPPAPMSRTTGASNNNTANGPTSNLLHPSSQSQHSSSVVGNSTENR